MDSSSERDAFAERRRRAWPHDPPEAVAARDCCPDVSRSPCVWRRIGGWTSPVRRC